MTVIGRFLPVDLLIIRCIGRPLSRKAAVQIMTFDNLLLTGRFTRESGRGARIAMKGRS